MAASVKTELAALRRDVCFTPDSVDKVFLAEGDAAGRGLG
jgi:hypothetical protein